MALRPNRVLVKLSGEALMGPQPFGVDAGFLEGLAGELAGLQAQGLQLALVVGGGNFFRGVSGSSRLLDRPSADQMGMLATVMNALALRGALEQSGVEARVQSALAMPQVAEGFSRREAIRHLETGRVVIFAAGTGNPFFTTDTAASLRAAEIDADLLVKGTKVDGVYSADPAKDPAAVRYARLSYDEVLSKRLGVMDLTAVTLCQEQRMPLAVCSIVERGALTAVLTGDESRATWIEEA